MKSLSHRVQAAFRSASVCRPRDFAKHGVNRVQLQSAVASGLIQRVGRGLYLQADSNAVTEQHTLAKVGQRIPRGTFCLLTALRFHDLTTQNPSEVWVALSPSAWRPTLDFVKTRIVHFSGRSLEEGVEQHRVEGIPVKVYNPAKTVADCFKFRHKLGIDVALEALRETLKKRRATMEELEFYAQVNRVARVMRPYLEALS
jgi:predicted transcriptional regulator of viral defense system